MIDHLPNRVLVILQCTLARVGHGC